jgi:hypothetical protein
MKKCNVCNQFLSLENFGKESRNKTSGLKSQCKKCLAEKSALWRKNNRDKLLLHKETFRKKHPNYFKRKSRPSYPSGHYCCASCKILKPFSEFNNDRHSKTGKTRSCTICLREKNKQSTKSEQYKKRKRIYNQNRRKNDLEFRLMWNLRSRLIHAIKNNSKAQKTIDLIGCSIDELKAYLSNMFVDGMSWENYGQWHIDHIKPCASFDLTKEEEQKICFHYTNLQPLWAKDNILKKDKILLDK